MREPGLFLCVVGLVFAGLLTACSEKTPPDYPFRPVSFTKVQVTDDFWKPRLETNRTVTIPYAFDQCVETGRIKNFEIAGGAAEGGFCSAYPFDDSDVYKIIEGASYSLKVHPDPELDAYVDRLIAKITAAQEEDGYLYTARTIFPRPPKVLWVDTKDRWVNLKLGHELYNAGHMYEAAVAHYQATGKRTFLDVAIKNADLVASVFGPGKKIGVPGHQEIEIGLVKLYRVTGDKKYLDLARFFLDERGQPHGRELFGEYSQDHLPVVDQSEPVGHAVRAGYMYSGMADVAALTGAPGYRDALERLWTNVVSRKMYITGGIGSRSGGESFGADYELPNATAYAETCASIANALWNHRMFLLTGEGKYIDVLERVLYNGILSGIALTGDLFFYSNPLESHGQHERSPWFTCACCPSNISRFIPSVPGYIYATRGNDLYVNLFVHNRATVELEDLAVNIEQETRYPWEGTVKITIDPEEEKAFGLRLRIPGWARGLPVPGDLYRFATEIVEAVRLRLNGEEIPVDLESGYTRIDRRWKKGDTLELCLPMPVRRVLSHENVEANRGRVALQRGPIVYCAEWPDNGGHVSHLVLEDGVPLSAEYRPALLNGLTVLSGEATALKTAEDGKTTLEAKQPFVAIPYYAWAHRGKGEMQVWMAREPSRARALPPPTIASTSRILVSGGKPGIGLNDQWEPQSSSDRSKPYLHWWPNKGTLEWVEYAFARPERVSSVDVYWFDDTGRGGCRVPRSWRLLYKEGDRWRPVKSSSPYATEKDRYNHVSFQPVKTSGLRLEIQLQENFSAGILEWKVNET